jgi:hypothetical protein
VVWGDRDTLKVEIISMLVPVGVTIRSVVVIVKLQI